MSEALWAALTIFTDAATPILVVWSWWRVLKAERPWNGPFKLALLSTILTTVSALLAIGALLYAHHIGGFAYYDPRLLRTYRAGLLLSLFSLLLALAAAIRSHPLRWLAPLCAVGSLAFWFFAAASE